MKKYKVFQGVHFDDVHLRVETGVFTGNEQEATEFANQTLKTILKQDSLHVIFGDDYFVIANEEIEKYQFEVCTKELPPPIAARNLSPQEQLVLIYDERYMTTPDDYQKVDWNLSKAYEKLKKMYPNKVGS